MKSTLTIADKDYIEWLSEIKHSIRSTQIRAALEANAALIEFYFDLGRRIVEKQAESAWGDKLVQRLSKDLKTEFPGMAGFSFTNLTYCKMFYKYFVIYPQPGDKLQSAKKQENTIYPQLGDKITPQPINQISPQLGGQLSPEAGEKLRNLVFNTPWGHIKEIISKVKNLQTAIFFFQETQKNGWNRDVLALMPENSTSISLR